MLIHMYTSSVDTDTAYSFGLTITAYANTMLSPESFWSEIFLLIFKKLLFGSLQYQKWQQEPQTICKLSVRDHTIDIEGFKAKAIVFTKLIQN